MSLTQSYGNAGAVVPIVGVNVPATVQVDALGNVVSAGGSATVAVPAGASTTAQVIKSSAGRLCRAVATGGSASTAALTFYDNASSASGVAIGVVPSGASAGQSFDFQMPASNGITAGLLSGSAAVTVSFY